MKNIKILALLMLIGLGTACTKNFEDINTDPYGITNESLKQDYNIVGALYKPMLMNIYTYDPVWVFQLQQNLIGDVYSGYMMIPTPFRGNSNNTNYDLVDGWNGFPWSVAYTNIMNNALTIKTRAENDLPNFYAWSLIIKVEAMHRVSDMFGPIVYSHFGENPTYAEYDSQKDVYANFFKDLDFAVETLADYTESSAFSNFDISTYGGDVTQWIKFANSLRLRLAIRISNVDPAKAKTEAEKAINNPFGLIETNADNFVIDAGLLHPLSTINSAWNDIRMGAPMESILKGYNDPRISQYFLTSEIVPGEYKGIRNGIDIASKSDYQVFSKLGPVIETTKVQLMTAAEVSFLRAEGALRNWNMGGTAQSFYENGVRLSFDQYGASGVDTYLADNTSVPVAYTDPVNSANNVSGADLSQATIAWNDADDNETKLEKIITQKWIAMFPDGQEAWSEFRRTGYPKLFTVVINNSGGKISTEEFIRRINLPASEYETNNAETLKAVETLKGPDNGGTRLWWDIGYNQW
jgi:hypothetical protein